MVKRCACGLDMLLRIFFVTFVHQIILPLNIVGALCVQLHFMPDYLKRYRCFWLWP